MVVAKQVALLVLCLISLISADRTEGYRVVRLRDLLEKSYLPVKFGEKFLIEIEERMINHFKWKLHPNHRNSKHPEELKLITPINLDSTNIGETFTREEKGVFHFKFEAGSVSGHEEVKFQKLDYSHGKVKSEKKITISVSSAEKEDL